MAVKVVDASALAAVLFGEPAAEEIASRLESQALVAPALIEYELGNTCWKKCRRHPQQSKALQAGLDILGELELLLHDVDLPAVLRTAIQRNVSFYDASYLWLAKQLNAELVTLDERLSRLQD